MLKEKTIQVPKEADEIFEALVEIVKATKTALADGFQPGQDVPAVVAAAWTKLPAAMQGIEQVPGEVVAHRGALVKSAGCAAGDLVDALIAPAPPATA